MRRWLLRLAIALPMLAILGFVLVFALLRASVPLDNSLYPLPGLLAEVEVRRDALGTITIDAKSDVDMARALGFVHAQERFFEMDLLRRSAAGELAALFGERALPFDRSRRVHRLRARSEGDLEQITGNQAAILKAYAEGVNEGLAALPVRPWAYLLLRQQPQPWTEVDSALVGYAMFFDLQDESNSRELALWRIRAVLPPALAALIDRDGSAWDSPLMGDARGDALLPTAAEVDLRRLPHAPPGATHAFSEPAAPGSNNFAVAAAATADGRAIVANDMHLGLRAPALWFRARLRYPEPQAPSGEIDVSGVTLPGIPAVIVGSNKHVAWGFTNSYGDWLDWVRVDYADEAKTEYRTIGDAMPIREVRERIDVAGGNEEWLVVRETEWGPILHEEPDGSALALRWAAHLPGSLNFELMHLARAADLDAAMAVARRAGVPAQNLVVADASGRIAWRLIGRIPRRVGSCDPRAPLQPLDSCDWQGFLRPSRTGSLEIVDPPSARLWTANARVTDGEALALIGDSGYALGARAKQIGDGLAAKPALTEADLLAIQLDDRALFLERWNRLLRETVAPLSAAEWPEVAEAAANWTGRASIDSAGYRLTRAFRLAVLERIRDGLLGPAQAALGERYVTPDLPQLESVAWPLLEQRPAHLLAPRFERWEDLLIESARQAATDVRGDRPGRLLDRTWGERNSAAICHPLASALGAIGQRWLCMPATPLAGDAQMPRVQSPDFGASQRMVVAPGHEDEGILQLPGGQSGHPLSPFWGAGHADWASGQPTPFLPGTTASALKLVPAGVGG